MKTLLLIISILLSITVFASDIQAEQSGPINITINERDTKSTVSAGIWGATLKPGLYYDYFISKPVQLEIGIAPIGFDMGATLGIKYHYYITDNFTTFAAFNISYFSDFFGVAQIGLRYEMDCGVTASLNIGAMSKYRSELERIDSGAIAGLQIGYSF